MTQFFRTLYLGKICAISAPVPPTHLSGLHLSSALQWGAHLRAFPPLLMVQHSFGAIWWQLHCTLHILTAVACPDLHYVISAPLCSSCVCEWIVLSPSLLHCGKWLCWDPWKKAPLEMQRRKIPPWQMQPGKDNSAKKRVEWKRQHRWEPEQKHPSRRR